jgi:hypothetical protein
MGSVCASSVINYNVTNETLPEYNGGPPSYVGVYNQTYSFVTIEGYGSNFEKPIFEKKLGNGTSSVDNGSLVLPSSVLYVVFYVFAGFSDVCNGGTRDYFWLVPGRSSVYIIDNSDVTPSSPISITTRVDDYNMTTTGDDGIVYTDFFKCFQVSVTGGSVVSHKSNSVSCSSFNRMFR